MGVDLELCVHAHGHDVDLIMEAAHKNNYFLGISSSYIWDLVFSHRGSDHIFSLILFPRQVKLLVFCRSFHLSNLYFDLPRVLPPVISRILCHCTTSCKSLIGVILRHLIPSLIGYISIMPTFKPCYLVPKTRSTISDDKLSLRRSSSSYHFTSNNKIDFELVSNPWFS